MRPLIFVLAIPFRVVATLDAHSRRNARIAMSVLRREHAQREEANAALEEASHLVADRVGP